MRTTALVLALSAVQLVLALPTPITREARPAARRGLLDDINNAVNNLSPFGNTPKAGDPAPSASASSSSSASSSTSSAPTPTLTPAPNSPPINMPATPPKDSKDRKADPVKVDAGKTTSDFLRPALFAQAAYCSSGVVTNWKCGPPCEKLGQDVEVLVTGGDNGKTPRFYVAHDKKENRLVVAHQGTDAKSILSIGNDLQFKPEEVNPKIFPNVSKEVQVHDGFADAHGRSAEAIIGGVMRGIQEKGLKRVLVVGHSLGAAIAVFDAMMLQRLLPSDVEMQVVTFGQPRSGNQAWADLLDSSIKNMTYITNQQDPVPQVPPRFLGFVHSSHELHIVKADDKGVPSEVVSCPGQDNENCTSGNNLLRASADDHKGPYLQEGIIMAAAGCPL